MKIADKFVASEDFATKKTIANDDGIGSEILLAQNHEQNRPLDHFAIDLNPTRADWAVAVVRPNHRAQVREGANAQVGLHLAQGCARRSSWVELPRTQRSDTCSRADNFEAILVVTRVNDAHKLHQEWV